MLYLVEGIILGMGGFAAGVLVGGKVADSIKSLEAAIAQFEATLHLRALAIQAAVREIAAALKVKP